MSLLPVSGRVIRECICFCTSEIVGIRIISGCRFGAVVVTDISMPVIPRFPRTNFLRCFGILRVAHAASYPSCVYNAFPSLSTASPFWSRIFRRRCSPSPAMSCRMTGSLYYESLAVFMHEHCVASLTYCT